MLKKIVATAWRFASGRFRSEFSDWSGLAEWVQRNPARWIYGIAGVWLSLYLLLSHKSSVAEFVAEHQPLKTGSTVYDLLVVVYLAACMFSFFSQKTGATWLRRSLVLLSSWVWLMSLWDIGAFGIVWIAIAWVLFNFVEGAVVVLDEASRRIRPLKYVLFTIAFSASYTSVGIVFALNTDNPFSWLPASLVLWGFTAWSMWSAYHDRSKPQGATLFNTAGLTKFIIAIIITVFLSEIMEIVLGMPVDLASRALWIEDNLNVSAFLASLINPAITFGLFGVGVATTWSAKTLYSGVVGKRP